MENIQPASSRKPPMHRAACDRCRAQKLRCVRTPEDTSKCKRCQTTGSNCHYGRPKPSGRPSINRPSRELRIPENTPKTGEVRIGPGRTYRPISRVNVGPSRRSKRDPEQLPTPGVSQHAHSQPSDADLGSDAMGWPDSWPRSLPTSISSDTLPPTPDFVLPGLSDNDLFLAPLPQGHEPMVLDGDYSPFIPPILDFGDLSAEVELQACEPEHDVSWYPDVPELSPSSAQFHYRTSPVPSAERSSPNGFDGSHLTKCDDPFRISQGGYTGQHETGAKYPSNSQSDWLQDLSELNMRVHRSLTDSASLAKQLNMADSPIEFPTEFAGQVVEISSAFLRVLEGTSDLSVRASPITPQSPQIPRERLDSDDNEDHDEDERIKASATFRTSSHGSGKTNIPQHSSFVALTEMSTVLQLLAVYLGLQKLHYLLYTAAYYDIAVNPPKQQNLSMEMSSKSRCHTDACCDDLKGHQMPIFPGLQLGSVSLERFRKQQVKLVIQVASHLLGEVEHLLGLPDGCRISNGGCDLSKGVLGASTSPDLLRMVVRDMKSPVGESGGDCSPVQAIKARLSQLRKIFRGSITL